MTRGLVALYVLGSSTTVEERTSWGACWGDRGGRVSESGAVGRCLGRVSEEQAILLFGFSPS